MNTDIFSQQSSFDGSTQQFEDKFDSAVEWMIIGSIGTQLYKLFTCTYLYILVKQNYETKMFLYFCIYFSLCRF